MTKRTYQDKLANINNWVTIVNHFWELHQGELYNDSNFWDYSLHSMEAQDWWDWLEIEPALKAQYPDAFNRYPKIWDAHNDIERKLMLGKPMVKQGVKNYNFAAFRALMNIKDVVNEINGTPTKNYNKTSAKKNSPAPTTPFERLFEL